jgi:hypothetical protein
MSHMTKQILILTLGSLLIGSGLYCSFAQSTGNCTYIQMANQSPACGGAKGTVLVTCFQSGTLPPTPTIVICGYADSTGTLGNCQSGASSGGLICASSSTQCCYTRTYSFCVCPGTGTPAPLPVTSSVSWPQPSGNCGGGGA